MSGTKRAGIGKRQRFRILQRCGFRCHYCGRPAGEVVLEIDHIIAVANGGTSDDANLVAACYDCNRGKSASVVVQPGASFLGWLRGQRLRDDWIGDLADDEGRAPLNDPASYRELCAGLRARHACREAIHAAWHAWREYRRGGLPTRATRAIQAANRRAVRANATDGSCLWLKRGRWCAGAFTPYGETGERRIDDDDLRLPTEAERAEKFRRLQEFMARMGEPVPEGAREIGDVIWRER